MVKNEYYFKATWQYDLDLKTLFSLAKTYKPLLHFIASKYPI